MKNFRKAVLALVVSALMPVAVTAQNAYVTQSTNGGSVSVISTTTQNVLDTISLSSPSGVAVSPDGTRVYVATSGNLAVIDSSTNNIITTVPVGNGDYGVAVSPDNSRVYVTNAFDGTVSVVDTITNKNVQTVTLPYPYGGGNPQGIAVSPDGSTVYVSVQSSVAGGAAAPAIDAINTSSYAVTELGVSLIHQENLQMVLAGTTLYGVGTTNTDGTGSLLIFNISTGKPITTIPLSSGGFGVALSPDGTRVYATDGTNIYVIDTSSNTLSQTITTSGADGIAITPDGAHLYVASGFANVYVYDLPAVTESAEITLGNNPTFVAIAPSSSTSCSPQAASVPRSPSTKHASVPASAGSCPVCQVKVSLKLIPSSQGPDPVYIQATFVPPASKTLTAYAAQCGYASFDWQQTITTLPGPSPFFPSMPSLIPQANLAADGSLMAPPPFIDPPNGGFTYFSNYNPYPYVYPPYPSQYFSPGMTCTIPKACSTFPRIVSADNTTLSFVDEPSDVKLPGDSPSSNPLAGSFIAFTTALVGVDNANSNIAHVLYSWSWNTTNNRTSGGISQTASINPVDSGSGTGGVTITTINGTQLPSSVTPSQFAATATGFVYSRISSTYKGSMSIKNIGNDSIPGPLQVLFTGLPNNITMTNATQTLSGIPYVTISSFSSLVQGESTDVSLLFSNPSSDTIAFIPALYSGSIN